MYGSTEMNRLRTSTWPSAGSGTSTSTTSKSSSVGHPTGREASRTCRPVRAIAALLPHRYAPAPGGNACESTEPGAGTGGGPPAGDRDRRVGTGRSPLGGVAPHGRHDEVGHPRRRGVGDVDGEVGDLGEPAGPPGALVGQQR